MKQLLPNAVSVWLKHPAFDWKSLAVVGRTRYILALLLATAGLFVALWGWLPQPFTLTVSIRTSRAVQLKLQYAGSDSQFSEDKVSVGYADSRSTFKTYKLPVATTNLGALRLRISPGAVVDFRSLTLKRFGRADIVISPSEITIFNSSCKMEQLGAITRFRTGPDSDGFDIDLHNSQFPLTDAGYFEAGAALLLCCSLTVLVWLVAIQQKVAGSYLRSRRISPRACRRIVLTLTIIFVLATILKLNGSSSSLWRFYSEGRLPDDHLLLGTAKYIRSDEWMVQTPWILSEAAQEPPFPTSNPNIGDQATALLVNVPIRHWTTVFRPQFWMFFILDPEHAFAWYWNLKWYVMIVGGFLFFRIVSRADTLATIAGTLLTFFAPYIQWWYSTGASLPETVGMTFIGLWALHSVLRGLTRGAIWLASLVTACAIENFIFCCYPRFQIPLVYFAVLVAIWMLFASGFRNRNIFTRSLALTSVVFLTVLCGLLWYKEVAPTLQMTAQLEYPGKVFSVGGDFSWARFFIPFLQFGMTEFHYPRSLVNACNAAGFVLLLPFIASVLVKSGRRLRDPLVVLILCFTAAVVYFMLVGVPPGVARYTGWYLVYATRGILPVGIALVTCLVRLLAWPGRVVSRLPWWGWLGALAVVAGAILCLSAVNNTYDQFVSGTMVVVASFYFTGICFLFARNARLIAMVLLLVPIVSANALVNPVGRGLIGFYRNETFSWLKTLTDGDHSGRWLVLGADTRREMLPYLIKAAGGDVLGGIRNNPDMRVLNILDPDRKSFSVWDRFAVVTYERSPDDKIHLTLTSAVSYTVAIPFASELLDRLDIRYLVDFDKPGDDSDVKGFRVLGRHDGIRVRVRDTKPQRNP